MKKNTYRLKDIESDALLKVLIALKQFITNSQKQPLTVTRFGFGNFYVYFFGFDADVLEISVPVTMKEYFDRYFAFDVPTVVFTEAYKNEIKSNIDTEVAEKLKVVQTSLPLGIRNK